MDKEELQCAIEGFKTTVKGVGRISNNMQYTVHYYKLKWWAVITNLTTNEIVRFKQVDPESWKEYVERKF